jgi:hypothetical protein
MVLNLPNYGKALAEEVRDHMMHRLVAWHEQPYRPSYFLLAKTPRLTFELHS